MAVSYILDGVRTAIGSLRGSLSDIRTDDLAAFVIKELMDRHPSISPNGIDDVILGCANQAGEDNRNVARMALLLAGLPYTVPGETVNRLCASGMSAVIHAHRAIVMGDGHLYIAGGVEHMTRAPWVISKSGQPFGNDAHMYDTSFGWRFVNPKMKALYGVDAMGETAENLAEKYDISREAQDEFALWSQQKALDAREAGIFDEEIIPLHIPRKKLDPIEFKEDEFMKPGTTMEGLAKLKPAFRLNGSVTAGNASGLNDGAAALLVCSQKFLEGTDFKPLAKIKASAIAGVEPKIMGIGPVYAIRKLLDKTGLTLDAIEIIEINEAFSVQVLACLRELGIADDDKRVNPNGGAIALGHPLGMSGSRILLTAARQLKRQQKRYAIVSMCIGVGQGYATLIENPYFALDK
ncbi:MAG: acetyl-CoA C-acyltransferase [Saprospiraceae bacterium]|nr:acetyl-CoA C-acyltransferase [Saprospiraceae bacterium]